MDLKNYDFNRCLLWGALALTVMALGLWLARDGWVLAADPTARVRITWNVQDISRSQIQYFKLLRQYGDGPWQWQEKLGPNKDGKLPVHYTYIVDEPPRAGDYHYTVEIVKQDNTVVPLAQTAPTEVSATVVEAKNGNVVSALNNNLLPVGELQSAALSCVNQWPYLSVSGWSYDPDNLEFGVTMVHIYDKDFSQKGFQYLINNRNVSGVDNQTALTDMAQRKLTPAGGKQYGFDIVRALPKYASTTPGDVLDINAYALNTNGGKNRRLSRGGVVAAFRLTVPDCGQSGLTVHAKAQPATGTAGGFAPSNVSAGYATIGSDRSACIPNGVDTNKDWKINQTEMTYFSRLSHSPGYYCGEGLDGYSTSGTDRTSCQPHGADADKNWAISSIETDFVVQLYNAGEYFCSPPEGAPSPEQLRIKSFSVSPEESADSFRVAWTADPKIVEQFVDKFEVWRKTEQGPWQMVKGFRPITAGYSYSFTDIPQKIGKYQYGVHLVSKWLAQGYTTEEDSGLTSITVSKIAPESMASRDSDGKNLEFFYDATAQQLQWNVHNNQYLIAKIELWRRLLAGGGWQIWQTTAAITEAVPIASVDKGYEYGIHLVALDGLYFTERDYGQDPVTVESNIVAACTLNRTYDMPVLSVKYLPLSVADPSLLDKNIVGSVNWQLNAEYAYENMKAGEQNMMSILREGSRYHGKGQSVLQYRVAEARELYIPIPLSSNCAWGKCPVDEGGRMKEDGRFYYRPDYRKILSKEACLTAANENGVWVDKQGIPYDCANSVDICDYVDNQGIKEVWLWGYHGGMTEPDESNQSMGLASKRFWNHITYGDLSNSQQINDLPVCQKTYTVYNFAYGRDPRDTSIHDQFHQFERIYGWADSQLFDGRFVGWNPSFTPQAWISQFPGTEPVRRCGWGHYTANSGKPYDYTNRIDYVWTDCFDWRPDGSGDKEHITCERWGCTESGYNTLWMQSLPGYDNNLRFNDKKLRNWWDFIGDFDQAVAEGTRLVCEE